MNKPTTKWEATAKELAKKAIKKKGLLQECEDEKKCERISREMTGMTIVRFANRSKGGS
jgi:hypothetical protein